MSDEPQKRSPRLLNASTIVGSMTSISRILGFLRDMVLARLFGAGPATDAFFIAFKIPNFMRRMFAEGAFSQAFVPVFAEYKTRKDLAVLKALIGHVSGTLGGILLIITTLGISAAPLFVLLFAPGFSDDAQRHALATEMLRITFPYLLLISLTALAGGILNSFDKFAIPALTPVFLNLSMIACALWLSPLLEEPTLALAWGVLIAGVVQLAFQLPFLQRIGMLPKPRWGWGDAGVQKIIRLMLPALFGSSIVQINLLLDTLIASFLVAGSVSWLYYSDRLVEFPLGVFGITLSTVILPHLSRKHAEQSLTAFSNTLDWALRLSLLISIPAMLGLILLAKPILITLFQYGEFSVHDMDMSSFSLMAYSLGLPAFMLIKVLAPGFYARLDTKTPVNIGIKAIGVNIVLHIFFVVPMVLFGFAAPHAGLALATATAAWVQAGLLFHRLISENTYQPRKDWSTLLIQILLAAISMTLVLYFLQPSKETWLHGSIWLRSALLLALITAGSAAFIGGLWLTGLRPSHLSEHH